MRAAGEVDLDGLRERALGDVDGVGVLRVGQVAAAAREGRHADRLAGGLRCDVGRRRILEKLAGARGRGVLVAARLARRTEDSMAVGCFCLRCADGERAWPVFREYEV